jgi:hypothetical protein
VTSIFEPQHNDWSDPDAVGARYDREAAKYPLLAAKVTRARYIAANLRSKVGQDRLEHHLEVMGDLKRRSAS